MINEDTYKRINGVLEINGITCVYIKGNIKPMMMLALIVVLNLGWKILHSREVSGAKSAH